MERRARRSLHAMVGPQGLLAIGELLGRERLGRVGRGERGVARRVPVLRDHDMGEPADQGVGDRDHRVALADRERAAGHEVGL